MRTAQGRPSQPRNVNAAASSATSLLVSWDSPSPANGVITAYTVVYGPESGLRRAANETTLSLPGNATQVSLEGLEKVCPCVCV